MGCRQMMERRSVEGVDTASLDDRCTSSMSDVHSFIASAAVAPAAAGADDVRGVTCMSSVVVSVLCSLCKRYLAMETAAGGQSVCRCDANCKLSLMQCC